MEQNTQNNKHGLAPNVKKRKRSREYTRTRVRKRALRGLGGTYRFLCLRSPANVGTESREHSTRLAIGHALDDSLHAVSAIQFGFWLLF